jgi:hypothetical protein
LAASPAVADNAKAREGGGSHASGGSDRQHEHAAGTSASGGSSTSSSSSSSSSGPAHPVTRAERDHPSPGTGTGHHHGGYSGGHGRHGGGYWSGGVWIGGGCIDCYDPVYYPRYPYPYYPYPYRYHYSYDESAAVRVQVKPEETRVYVDGYYAGIVDDFDGLLQRLYLPRGQHEIALKLEGFRSHRFVLYGVPGRTIKLHFNMVQGTGDDEPEDLAGAHVKSPVPPPQAEGDRDDDDDSGDKDEAYEERRPPVPPLPPMRGETGTLSLDVRPGDASVYIDGRAYQRAAREDVKLAGGLHRLEVVRPGYQSFEREVEIKPGKTADLDVHLEKK